jgi:transcriptional repressor NrdR
MSPEMWPGELQHWNFTHVNTCRRFCANRPPRSAVGLLTPAGAELTRPAPRPYRDDVRCPYCGGSTDRVVDSRTTDAGAAIRRRRACLLCGRRYTTFERVEEVVLIVRKRSGGQEPFDQAKLRSGIERAAKNRPIEPEAIEELVDEVSSLVRARGPVVATDDIGRAVLERLRDLDEVTYLRFASVYKGFEDATDFAREVGLFREPAAPSGTGRAPTQPEPAG